jgi:Protein of unknown function (DUF3352)
MPLCLCFMNVNPRKDKLQAQVKTLFETVKNSPRLLPIGGSIALITVGGLAFWALTRSTVAPGALPTGANVIPQDALLAMTVSTDPNQWKQLRSFGTPTSQAMLDQTLAQIRDRLLTPSGIDYERDIQPWVGDEASFALFSPHGESTTPAEGTPLRPPTPQPAVLILPIRDGNRAKDTLEQSRGNSKLTWSARKYKDIDIQESQGTGPTQSLCLAALDNKLLVIANSARSIEHAIDTYKGEKNSPSIAQTPGYSNALGQIQTGPSFARLYMNLPEMSALSQPDAPKKSSATSNPTQGWTMNANLNGDGIQFKSLLWLKPETKTQFTPNDQVLKLPDRLPAETFILTSGTNFTQFWTDYTRDYVTSPIKLLDPTSFKQEVRGALGMDVEQDFTRWMGEFAVSAIAAPSGSNTNTPVGLVLMVQASDRRAADRAFTQLDDTMTRKYGFKVEPQNIAGQEVVQWTMGTGAITITRGWLDDNVAFLSLGAPVASTFLPRPTSPITRQSGFQQVISTQPKLQGGHFYMDLERASSYKNLPLLRFPDALKVWSEAIRSIGVNTQVTGDRTTRYDATVLLKRGNPPGPLPSPTVSASSKPTPSLKPSPTPSKKP